MNLIILVLIAFFTTIITFATCGAGGGLMMLVALAQLFSRIGCGAHSYFLRADGDRTQLIFSTAASWLFIKARHAETTFGFWYVVGINAGVNILTIIIIFAIVAITRL